MSHSFFIYTDGGARGNPGPAAFAVIIKNQNHKEIQRISRFLGKETNNQAEYEGVIAALLWLKKRGIKDSKVYFYLDSELVVKQLKGEYKIKNEGLKPLFWRARELMMEMGLDIDLQAVKREFNKEADKLVNKTIDQNV